MNIVVTILLTVLIFGAIIFIHELGHFIVARLTGVTVVEFALGMGPALLRLRGKKTLYSLRLFPIGGFCAMLGEDAAGSGSVNPNGRSGEAEPPDGGAEVRPQTEEDGEAGGTPETLADDAASPVSPEPGSGAQEPDTPEPGSLNSKSVPARIAISAAGAFMNLLLGFLVILCTLLPEPYYASSQVAVFNEGATSSESGLQVGDTILTINGSRLFSYQDITFQLLRDSDGIVEMEVDRDGETVRLPEVRFIVQGEGRERTLIIDFKVLAVEQGVFNLIREAFGETLSLARNAWVSVADLITGREMLTGKMGLQDLSGPIGVGQIVGQAASIGWQSLLSVAAFISISIGMFNLLPFPALDGGRILFLLIEAVRRKPVPAKWEGYINAAGLILLFGLMILVAFKDLWNLF